VRVLLDTHTLLWAGLSKGQLSAEAAAVIGDPDTVPLVSAASIWNIATKIRLGKLPEVERLEARILEELREAEYQLLPITPEIALRAGRIVGDHGDPFDRIIAAQALAEDIPLISVDAKLYEFGVRRIW
jgi:PIN domain nuclease of toxin-antitoxin system